MPVFRRKFLCGKSDWRVFIQQEDVISVEITKGFLALDPERLVNVTLESVQRQKTQATLTVFAAKCSKYEYLIPPEEAYQILSEICLKPLVIKDRYCIATKPQTFRGILPQEEVEQNWKLDIYHNTNEGLVTNEVELLSKNEELVALPWIGEEITDDDKYKEVNLVLNPYNKWPSSRLERALKGL